VKGLSSPTWRVTLTSLYPIDSSYFEYVTYTILFRHSVPNFASDSKSDFNSFILTSNYLLTRLLCLYMIIAIDSNSFVFVQFYNLHPPFTYPQSITSFLVTLVREMKNGKSLPKGNFSSFLCILIEQQGSLGVFSWTPEWHVETLGLLSPHIEWWYFLFHFVFPFIPDLPKRDVFRLYTHLKFTFRFLHSPIMTLRRQIRSYVRHTSLSEERWVTFTRRNRV
jgi:hypothetical protein